MTDTNWPDQNRPGVPMFPEYRGKHTLIGKRKGKEVTAIWGAGELLRPEWDVVGLSAVSEDVARYFTYVRCEEVYITPTQINEMLAAERERCLAALAEHGKRSELGYNDSTGDEEKQYWRVSRRAVMESVILGDPA